ncbi:DNA translocase FtsK, partial [Methylobacterium sp. E-005]|nr:DNA translocase FtsK [Methylobacterium sp. E-005]
MRASGRPPYSHRDPARPVRGGDRSGLSLGALAHRLMALRVSLTRRLSGSTAGLPVRPAYGALARRAEPSWLTTPAAMVGRDMQERSTRPRATPPEHVWPDEVFDDRASLDAPEAPVFESRIDRSASTPGVLVRQPRRPAAIAPDHALDVAPTGAPVAAPHPAMTPSAVRYTRTPDSVLQERRQRALEAERVALERARAEAQAAALALETERAAREQAEQEQAERARIADMQAEQAVAADVLSGPAPEGEVVPLWRQPFVAPPGVRFFRTPDRRPVRPAVELSASTAVIVPVEVATTVLEPAIQEAVAQQDGFEAVAESETIDAPTEVPAQDWSDLPDWSGVQPWFGGADWSSVEAWAALEPQAPEPAPAPVAPEVAALPPRPVYVLDRLVRFDQPPRPADGQDNGRTQASEPARSDAADAAIRSAFLPAAPVSAPASAGLSLVFGPGSPAAEPPAAPAPETPRRAPMLNAMAARAAIRAAGQPTPTPAVPPVQQEAAPAPVASGPERAEAERVVIPMTPRPVLLRGKLAPQPDPAPAEIEAAAEIESEVEAEPVVAALEPVAPAPVALPMVAPRAHLIP